ncbi:hypothetical protein ACOI1C_07760 [Bacillus sp. DJP31]|uniref:hypothetical protein n=1 Tax=Bacillus sp. DJP31 TaxID=3409789 RepID=UPI003BB813E4
MGLLEILLLVGFLLGVTIFLLLYKFGDFTWLISSLITLALGIFIFVCSEYFISGFEGIPIGAIGGAIILFAFVFLVLPFLWNIIKVKLLKK